MKASGEDNNAKLIAAYFKFKGLNANYINPKDAGLLVTDEHASAQVLPESYDRLFALREREGIIVFPGFSVIRKTAKLARFLEVALILLERLWQTAPKPSYTRTLRMWMQSTQSIPLS